MKITERFDPKKALKSLVIVSLQNQLYIYEAGKMPENYVQ